MGKILVVTEKPNVAQSIGAVMGTKKRGSGFMEGDGVVCAEVGFNSPDSKIHQSHLAGGWVSVLPVYGKVADVTCVVLYKVC